MLFIAPHNDDEALWGAYTLMRDKPLVFVATISKRQGDNGLERLRESYQACKFLGCPMISSGIYDSELTEENLTEVLKHFVGDDIIVFAPAYYENGHPDHNICSNVASKLFDKVVYYNSYRQIDGRAVLDTSGAPSLVEMKNERHEARKHEMLQFYKTQIGRDQTKPFFLNVSKEYYAE